MSAPEVEKVIPASYAADTFSNDNSLVADSDEAVVENLRNTGAEVGLTWRTVLAAVSLMTCYNAYLFTLLIPPTILSFINKELGPDPSYTWISVSWNLGGAIFVTMGGRLSDIFGRRWFFIGGSVILIIGSIVSATGQSIPQMIAGGAIFGAGSGFLEMSFGAVQETVPNEYRLMFVGLFDASSIVAQFTPLIAWVIINNTGNWRNCYYLMIGFQCLNLIILFLFYHPPQFKTKHARDGRSFFELLRDFDWVGLFLFTAGCTLFICGVAWGGSLHPWKSASTLAPIIVGFFTLVGLGFWEVYAPLKEPLLPPRLFKRVRQFTMPCIVMAIVGMQYYSTATLWARFSQLLYANGDISKGLYAEVIGLGTVIGGCVAAMSKKIGHQRWQILFVIALQTACVGAMSTSTLDNAPKSIVLTCIISGCTAVVICNCLVVVGFGIVHQEDIGTASGIAGTSRLLFGAVATAIFSNVTTNKYTAVLPGQVKNAVKNLGFTGSLPALIKAAAAGTYTGVAGVTPAIKAAATLANKEAYLTGAHLSYEVALAFGLFGCICALFIPSIDTRKFTKNTVALQESDRQHVEQLKKEVVG